MLYELYQETGGPNLMWSDHIKPGLNTLQPHLEQSLSYISPN